MKNEKIHSLLLDMNRELGEVRVTVEHIQKKLENNKDKKKFLLAWGVSALALITSLLNHFRVFVLCLGIGLLFTGCVQLGQSRASKSTVVGLSIKLLDPITNTPRVDLGYITHEVITADKAHKATIKKRYKDVDLFESKGSIDTTIDVSGA